MGLHGKCVLLTGASRGIGRCTALELARQGARLALVARDGKGLQETRDEITGIGCEVHTFAQDLSRLDDLVELCRRVTTCMDGIDVLINNAGTLDFSPVEMQQNAALERLYWTNVLAPVVLCRELLGHFRNRGHGHIVNVGSIFGSIGFPYFAAYSSTKFAMRGYSEALRRELTGTAIRVTYVAPRGTRTRLAELFGRMADEVGMTLDDPEQVAKQIVRAVEAQAGDRYLGFPESLFVRINALMPRIVDRALRAQSQKMRPFAVEAASRGEA